MASARCVPSLLTWPGASRTRLRPWPPVRRPGMFPRPRVPPTGRIEEPQAYSRGMARPRVRLLILSRRAGARRAPLCPRVAGGSARWPPPPGERRTRTCRRGGEGLRAGGAAVIHRTEILIRPAISVVVCAFTEDRWEDICRVLGSLRAQTEAPGEVILVIDHCPPLLR